MYYNKVMNKWKAFEKPFGSVALTESALLGNDLFFTVDTSADLICDGENLYCSIPVTGCSVQLSYAESSVVGTKKIPVQPLTEYKLKIEVETSELGGASVGLTYNVKELDNSGSLIIDQILCSNINTDQVLTRYELTFTTSATTQYLSPVVSMNFALDNSGVIILKNLEIFSGADILGLDSNAIHDNAAGEINAITQKVSPANADLLIIEDSADGFNKKKIELTNLLASGGTGTSDHTLLSNIGINTHPDIDTHIANVISNPHSVDQTDIGLGNVDNTSDLDKPVSTATQTALDLKTDETDLQIHIADPITHNTTTAIVGEGDTHTLTHKTLDDYTNYIHADALHFRVKATENILKGQPVTIIGWNVGESAYEVELANQALNVANGLASTDMLAGVFGFLEQTGSLINIDTSSFAEGSILYLDGVGVLTETEPTTGFSQPIAYVVRSHAVNGALQVNADYPKQDAEDVRVFALNFTDNLSIADDTVQKALDTLDDHTHTASEITNFDTEVSNNTAVALNTAKVTYPVTDSTKVDFISVTQSVDLDSMESDQVLNNAKISADGSIKTHSDVYSTMTPLDGQVLTFDSTNGWQSETSSTGVTDHTLLSNIGTKTHAQIDTHLADSANHYTQASISISAIQVSDFDTEVANNTAVVLNSAKETNIAHPLVETAVPVGALFTDTVYDDTTIQAEVDLNNAKISADGSIKTHSDVHSTMTPLDGQVLTFYTTNGWQAESPASGVTDHTLLSNIGTNTHVQIDTHISDSATHYTQASISIPANQISDFDIEVSNNTAVALNTAKETNIAHPLVESAVPVGALFTDTIYDDTTIQAEVDLNTAKVTCNTANVTSAGALMDSEVDADIKTLVIVAGSTIAGVNTGDQDLSSLALKSNVLELNNTLTFTPDQDYEPATKKYVDDNAGGSVSGWTSITSTLTYQAWDISDRIAWIDTSSSELLNIQAGDRVKFTQATGGVKYGIVTYVSSGYFKAFMYEGDIFYDELVTEANYSHFKAPYGFDTDPGKWKFSVIDTTERVQATPTVGTWYNNGNISITVPAGRWDYYYAVMVAGLGLASGFNTVKSTLSTSSTTESDSDLTVGTRARNPQTGSEVYTPVFVKKTITHSFVRTYYLNEAITEGAASPSNILFENQVQQAYIEAVCSYL